MEKTKVTEEIRAFNKRIFRELHNRFDFDFEKNIGIFRIDGKFTVASVRKFVEERGFKRNARCVLLVSNKWRANHHAKQYKNVGGAFNPVLLNLHNCSFDTIFMPYLGSYWRKADFDDDRKLVDAIAYIIVQNYEHLAEKKVMTAEDNLKFYLQRFKLVEVNRFSDGSINSFTLRKEGGEAFCYNVGWFFDDELSMRDVIDGSGYLIGAHRDALRNRLKAFKERKAKEAYSAVDYTVKVATIDALIEAAKSVLVVALQDAKDRKAVEEVERKLSNFTWVMRDAENFKRMTAEKSYKSIEESENAYNRILSSLIK